MRVRGKKSSVDLPRRYVNIIDSLSSKGSEDPRQFQDYLFFITAPLSVRLRSTLSSFQLLIGVCNDSITAFPNALSYYFAGTTSRLSAQLLC